MLLGIMNRYLPQNAPKDFLENARFLKSSVEKGRYGRLFKTLTALCEFDSLKIELYFDIYSAYKSGDREKMRDILQKFPKLISLFDDFYEIYRSQWLCENKGVGFEIQNIRMGGVRQNIIYTQSRLVDWLDDRISVIDEFEEKRLRYNSTSNNDYNCFYHWKQIVSKCYM